MARAPRVRQSVAAIQADAAVTLATVNAALAKAVNTLEKVNGTLERLNRFIEDLHDGGTLTLRIGEKDTPIKVVINPKDDAPQNEKG